MLKCPECKAIDIIPPDKDHKICICLNCGLYFKPPPFKGHHLGDPCIYCDTPHDEVEVGPCPNSNNL